ncbi:DUF2642 domain-containing protein [Paenibacillus sp. UNC499MF]|uniref:DUF2642 domain-containing protein n=1 Tax=Paenibacillus sp. UNC499MF TaxID=1502751 RepID=UPI00089FACEB|nr:DUF2642 domain-containing protein [Paenibacillus sp. UNC499MF]SEG68896.1 spore coat protein B [Paenibacillus sp. UNC499MF]
MSVNELGYVVNLIGEEVKINRGGPDSVTGKLINVHTDYLSLQTNEGVIYINASHIKSVTESAGKTEYPSYANVVSAYDFQELLKKFHQKFVRINRGGPEKIEGVIAEVKQDYLVLVVNNEVVRIALFHIKSIGIASSNKSGGNQKNQSKGGQTRGNQTRGNQTRGNQTRGNQTRGNQTRGNQTRGNQTRGNQTRGNQTRGNQTRGNQSHRNHTKGFTGSGNPFRLFF